MLHGFAKIIAKILIVVASKTKVYGKENIKDGNVIFVCNHLSIFDAFINFSLLPSKTHFMAKKELFANKIVGGALSRIQVFPVDRGKVDLKSIRHACSVLENGGNLCIYPQGTRCINPEIEDGQMHNGIGMIALRCNSRVIPLMFERTPGFFKKNVLYIGKEIDLSEFNGKRAGSEEQHAFTQKIAEEMNTLLENGRNGKI